MNNLEIKVPHPEFGYVIFVNPSLREQEVLEHYRLLMGDCRNGGPRQSGNSTRLIDFYIQELFRKNTIAVIDHYPIKEASVNLLERITDRLSREHCGTKFTVDKIKNTITLI